MGRHRRFAITSNPALESAQPTTKYIINAPERKADQSTVCSTEVKTEWSVWLQFPGFMPRLVLKLFRQLSVHSLLLHFQGEFEAAGGNGKIYTR
jgi:hypothetical protein